MTMPRRTAASRPAFTIVELLVVISIIAILLALTSVGVVQAGKAARQTKALSNLKQVATAWTQYASQNDDRAMPGFMDDGVQAALKIKVRDRDGNRVDPQFCRTYPYRLLPFLDHDRSLMYDYLADYEQTSEIPPAEIAANPAFGYNAYYLGGWWTTDSASNQPRMRFSGTGYYKTQGQLVERQEMVARSLSQIQRPSDMIVFGSSFTAQPGIYKNPDELARGGAWIVPHRRGMTDMWVPSDGQGSGALQVLVPECVPLRRIKATVPTVRADLSTSAQGLRDLMDQSRWMNNAGYSDDTILFSHPEN